MTEFEKIIKVDEFPENGRFYHEFEDETVVIFRVGEQFYAIADLCTHDGGPLEDGALEDHKVECPRHGACFDIRTGAALNLPATEPVPTYQTKVEDGYLFVEKPESW